MDFDIAGLLANPDFQYMLAGIGQAGGQAYNNPFAQAVGGITQQGIGAKNQAALIAKLLGLGGGAKGEGTTTGLAGWDQYAKELGLPPGFINKEGTKFSTDGKSVNISMPSPSGQSGTPPLNMASATPPSGGQPGIINPSVGLPGDLSGLSLAGLKPEDINKAITLGLTGADLERKKVSDLYLNRYHEELVDERRAARRAKDVSAPVGDGLSLAQYNSYPSDVKAHLYVNHLRKQSGQTPLSFEQFKQQSDTNSTMQLIDRANRDPVFKKGLMEYKQAGATNINLGDKAALQKQTNAINTINDLKKPSNAKLFDLTTQEQGAALNDKTFDNSGLKPDVIMDKTLTKAKVDKALALVQGTGAKIVKGETRVEGNDLIITFIGEDGVKDVIRRSVK